MGQHVDVNLHGRRSGDQGDPQAATASLAGAIDGAIDGRIDGAIDGALNFYKPRGITSARALYRIRRITGVRKSGHAGTLDPGAEGVLVVCLGQGTRLTEAWMDQPKVYRATARLDITSESFDADGEVSEVRVEAPPTVERVRDGLDQFVGETDQVPPSISAIKIRGQPAYRLARRGQRPVLRARRIRIHWIHLHGYRWPEVDFELACGRGTYVRALIRDVGAALGTGGCLISLTRTAVGPFRADRAWSFDSLEAERSRRRWLTPLPEVHSMLARRPVAIPPAPPRRPSGA